VNKPGTDVGCCGILNKGNVVIKPSARVKCSIPQGHMTRT
jgi:hypothetical protein